MQETDLCPCGSGHTYRDCCGPFIKGDKVVDTPERLLRTRFTAAATANGEYFLKTWFKTFRPKTKVNRMSSELKKVRYTKLEIVSVEQTEGELSAVIHYRAYCRVGVNFSCIDEHAVFISADGTWYYTQGIPAF